MIRDGRPNYVICSLPLRIQAQQPPDAEFLVKVKEKLKKVIDREYITPLAFSLYLKLILK